MPTLVTSKGNYDIVRQRAAKKAMSWQGHKSSSAWASHQRLAQGTQKRQAWVEVRDFRPRLVRTTHYGAGYNTGKAWKGSR